MLEEGGRDGAVEVEAARGCAALTGGADCTEEDCGNGERKVGVWEDDGGVVPAKLKEDFAKAGLNSFADNLPDAFTSSKGYFL